MRRLEIARRSSARREGEGELRGPMVGVVEVAWFDIGWEESSALTRVLVWANCGSGVWEDADQDAGERWL